MPLVLHTDNHLPDSLEPAVSMRVLFINDGSLLNPILRSQGIPHLFYLAQQGYEIHLLSLDPRAETDRRAERDKMVKQFGDKIHFLFFRPLPSKILKATIQILAAGPLLVMYYVVKYKIEVIHARSYFPAFFGLLAKTVLGTKLIFDMRGLMIDELVSKRTWTESSVVVRILRFLERRCILSSDEIVVVSDKFREHVMQLAYVQLSKKKISIESIPNCVEAERFEISLEVKEKLTTSLNLRDRYVLVYSGSLASWQCSDEVLMFLSLCLRREPKAFLLIVTYDDETELMRHVERYGIKQSDYKIVHSAPEDVPKHLSLGRIGILFRREELLNTVSSPIKFGEYLAAGVPVLISHGVGDTEDIVKKHNVGIVVEGLTEPSLQNASKAAVDFFRMNRVGVDDVCRKVASHYFSLQVACEKYEGIYRKLQS